MNTSTTINHENFSGLTLKELFAQADAIGNKHLSEDEQQEFQHQLEAALTETHNEILCSTYYIDTTVEREYSRQELLDLCNGIAKPMWRTDIPTLDEVIEYRNISMQEEWEELLQYQDDGIEWLDENNHSYFQMSVIKWENAVKFI